MKSGMKSKKSVTTIIGVSLLLGSVIIWKAREKKINREIDEFDRIMRELKVSKVEQYDYYKKKHVKERK